MQIPEGMLNCVGFLGAEVNGKSRYCGTAFFASTNNQEGESDDRVYLVTARHCVLNGCRSKRFWLRLNDIDGQGSRELELPNTEAQWSFPESASIDLAVLALSPDDQTNWTYIAWQMFALETIRVKEKVDIGDDVMVVGLFSPMPGIIRNQPIVRTGIISAMPGEPLQDDSGHSYDAFLVELHSLGGVSGSPVFVVYKGADKKPVRQHMVMDTYEQHKLFGVARGHYDLRSSREVADDPDVNTGIAVVTPVDDLWSLLNS